MTAGDCVLTLTANAGVMGTLGGFAFALDALHTEETEEFSSLSPEMARTVLERGKALRPQAVLVTHAHRDHYSPRLTEAMLRECGAPLVAPWQAPEVGSGELRLPGGVIRWLRLRHKGQPESGGEANFGFLIEAGGRTLFAAGDADPGDSAVRDSLAGLRPDIALLNFPWLTTRAGRAAFDALESAHTVLLHLPFRQDDAWGYVPAAEDAVNRYYPHSDIRVMSEFLQTETIDFMPRQGGAL